MDKKKILALLQDEKKRDYTFNIAFFLIFSFFLYFAIRPNLLTVFRLQQQHEELRLKNKEAEATIMQIVSYQSTLEQYRDVFPLLSEAVPQSPGLVKAVEDVRMSASASGVLLDELSVEGITFHDAAGTGELQTYVMSLGGKAEIGTISDFLTTVMRQRRLKTIENFTLSAASDGEITITLQVRTYYL